MTSRTHRLLWSWATTVALTSGAVQLAGQRVALAQEDPSATETAAARALAIDGLKLAQAGKCDEAIPKLDRAEKLHHSPIVLSRLGECHVAQGHLVEGTEMLRKVLREPLPANPSPALVKAYERAQSTLDWAKPRIGSLTISVTAPADAAASLKMDGKDVPLTLIDTEMPADPGEHVVEVSAPGFLKANVRVSLAASDKKAVSLKLERDPYASAPAETATAGAERPTSPPPSSSNEPATAATAATPRPAAPVTQPNHTAAYVAWGVGGVGIGLGAAFGLITLNDKSELDERCGAGGVCPKSERGAIDAAKRSGNISTVAFGIGGVGLVLGTVLFLAAGGDADEKSATATPARFAGLSNGRAMLGPRSVQLAADF
ncbi:MAG TPA: hypothetical protein VER33_19330 [Polyangiaceae bacterium]|nr:hypothetical protein [Polyangiaceae bacterium]